MGIIVFEEYKPRSVFVFRLGAETHIINEHTIPYPNNVTRHAAEVMVKKIPDEQEVNKSLWTGL